METTNKREKKEKEVKAYLDTNIFIDYIWSVYFSEEKKKKSTSFTLVNKGSMGEYEIFISFYTLMEIHQHFTDYYLQQNAIRDGFGFRDFHRVRRDYVLEEDQITTVLELVEILRKNKKVKTHGQTSQEASR